MPESSFVKVSQDSTAPAVALDVGSHGIRSIRRERLRLVSRAHRTCYTLLPDSEQVEEALRLNQVGFTRSEDGIVVAGNAAIAAAATMRLPVVNALPKGSAPKHDLVSRQILSLMVDSLLCGDSSPEQASHKFVGSEVEKSSPICMLSISSGDSATEEFFAGLTQLKGRRPVLLNAGTAAGLATLQERRLTGVTVDAGASSCTVTVLHAGREIVSGIVREGGQTLDANFFDRENHILTDSNGSTFRDDESARRLREAYSAPGAEPPMRSRLGGHQKLAREVARMSLELFEQALVLRSFVRPTAVSIVGGLANDRYFISAFEAALRRIDTARYFEDECLISGDEFTIARGLLLAAEAESVTFPGHESKAA